jgi:hypothetical protein
VGDVTASVQTCRCCGLVAAAVDGPTDPYSAASPACWEAFGRLHLVGSSQLSVDTYMAQHPGLATPAGRRSVLTHLVGLHLALDEAESPDAVRRALGRVFPDKRSDPPEISPVPDLRGTTVADVLGAPPGERAARETQWAWSVWAAWSGEHARVVALAGRALRARP